MGAPNYNYLIENLRYKKQKVIRQANPFAAGSKKETTEMQIDKTWSGIGNQLAEYVHHTIITTSDHTEANREANANKIYAKAQAGQRLTQEEKNFLAKHAPVLYAKVMRAEAMRKALEDQIKTCTTEEEVDAAYMAAYQSISKDDPDRELLIRSISAVWKEAKEKGKYNKQEERQEQQRSQPTLQYEIVNNNTGYQEMYVSEREQIVYE